MFRLFDTTKKDALNQGNSPFSIERMHKPKDFLARQQGKTIDNLVWVIGCIQVTDNDLVVIIVPYMNRIRHLKYTFQKLCIEHYKEKPVFYKDDEWGIEGYSTKVIIVSMNNERAEYYERHEEFHVIYED